MQCYSGPDEWQRISLTLKLNQGFKTTFTLTLLIVPALMQKDLLQLRAYLLQTIGCVTTKTLYDLGLLNSRAKELSQRQNCCSTLRVWEFLESTNFRRSFLEIVAPDSWTEGEFRESRTGHYWRPTELAQRQWAHRVLGWNTCYSIWYSNCCIPRGKTIREILTWRFFLLFI